MTKNFAGGAGNALSLVDIVTAGASEGADAN